MKKQTTKASIILLNLEELSFPNDFFFDNGELTEGYLIQSQGIVNTT